MSAPAPPRWSALLLAWAADPDVRDAQLGDLAEEFAARAARDRGAAVRWYRRQALRSLGPNLLLRVGRALRSRHGKTGDGIMRTLAGDLRLALRRMASQPAFTGVVILTVGLGIGAISTTYSVVYGLVLNPFPFPEPDRIVGVGTAYPRLGTSLGFMENLSPAEFEDIRDNAETLEDVVAWDMGNRQIDTDGPPENVFSAFWWGDALRTLGMEPHLGRGFAEDEIITGANVVMLSYGSWVDRFGADSSMVGEPLSVNGAPYALVGIVPEGVDLYGTDLWMVMPVGPEIFPRNGRQFQVLGRIAEGATLGDVNVELAGLADRTEQAYRAEFEEYAGWSMQAMTWADVSSAVFRNGLWVLLGAVTFVLLLVCANTANLLLGRAQTRRRDVAVRSALGAGRGRIVTQMLVESVTLALAAGALGVGLAVIGVRGVRTFTQTLGPSLAGSIELNGPVLLVTAGVSVAAGVLFGLAPAIQTSGAGLAGVLQSEGRGTTTGADRQRLQRVLVALEVAVAFVLLAGGGLMVNSFLRVNRVETGFDAERVLTMRLTLPREEYQGDAVPAFFRELTELLESIPGVSEAGAGTQFPPIAFSFEQVFFDRPEADAEATLPTTLGTIVTRGYFEALGIPLLRGRTFDDRDVAGSPNVAVINEEAVARYFGDTDPLGQRLKLGAADEPGPWWEIVGVVASTKNLGLDSDPFPEIFAVHEQVGGSQNQLYLVLRAEGDPAALVPAVREEVLRMDADQPVYAIRTVGETYRQGVAPMQATTLLMSIFAAFALVLAAGGIFAVVSFSVGSRTQEIGLGVALGADRARVRRLVVRQALVPVLVGAASGLTVALALRGGLETLLFQVRGSDPLTLVLVAVLLVGVAALASWIPAYRAARLDPVEALRAE